MERNAHDAPNSVAQPVSHSKPWATVAKLGYMHPATGRMLDQQSSAYAPGRTFTDHHVDCCPCIESQELFKDQVFDFEGWQRHKSWRRHAPNWWVCVRILLYYWPPLLVVLIISISIGFYETWRHSRWPDLSHQEWLAPFQLMSFVLSLLLVFRTNSAYGRWWEARIFWGTVIELTRDLMRETLTFAGQDDAALIDMVGRWTIALPYVLKAHLTELTDLNVQLKGVLLPYELEFLHDCSHRPSVVGQALSDAVNSLDTHPFKALAINKRISQFYDIVAGCERLYRQPIPSGYTRHTSRFLVIWSGFLPFALWHECQWLTPFVSVIVTFLLLGVENIGVQIEQPFSVLPMEQFCATIRANIIEQLQIRMRSGELLWQALDGAPPTPSPHSSLFSAVLGHSGTTEAEVPLPAEASTGGSRSAACRASSLGSEAPLAKSMSLLDRRASFQGQQVGLREQFLATGRPAVNMKMMVPPAQHPPFCSTLSPSRSLSDRSNGATPPEEPRSNDAYVTPHQKPGVCEEEFPLSHIAIDVAASKAQTSACWPPSSSHSFPQSRSR